MAAEKFVRRFGPHAVGLAEAFAAVAADADGAAVVVTHATGAGAAITFEASHKSSSLTWDLL
jgi:hypothetical protein